MLETQNKWRHKSPHGKLGQIDFMVAKFEFWNLQFLSLLMVAEQEIEPKEEEEN